MANFQDKKIEIIQGINDVPEAPSTLKGGNISHFYNVYNQFVDSIQSVISQIETNINDIQQSINTIQDSIDSLDTRITDLENNQSNTNSSSTNDPEPSPTNVTEDFSGIDISTFGEVGTLTQSGKIISINSDILGDFNIIFYLNSNSLTTTDAVDDGDGTYTWTFEDLGDLNVSPGDLLEVEILDGEFDQFELNFIVELEQA